METLTPTLMLTPQEHADLRERLDRLYDYLEVERDRKGWSDQAHDAVMDAVEALDLLDAATTRMIEMVSEVAEWEWASQADGRMKH